MLLDERNADAWLRGILGWTLAGVVGVDLAWASVGNFQLEGAAYLGIAGISAALFVGAWFYGRVRRDDRLQAMLFGTGFLCAFSAAFSVLNYFLLIVAGTRIDPLLATLDAALGFHWPALIAFAGEHPFANLVLALSYNSVLLQIAVLMVCLGWFGRTQAVYCFCLALALAAAATVGFWAFFPSFGAFTVYELSPALAGRVRLVVEADYVRELLRILDEGPGRIAPDQVKGLIAFPSFHAVLAVLVAVYARELRGLREGALVLNGLVLLATPIHGGHFVIDIAAGAALALGSAGAVNSLAGRKAESTSGRRTEADAVPTAAIRVG